MTSLHIPAVDLSITDLLIQWLYYVGPRPPELTWGPSSGVRLDEGFHSKAERAAARASGQAPVKRLSTVQNIVTPPAFAELLISLAKAARP